MVLVKIFIRKFTRAIEQCRKFIDHVPASEVTTDDDPGLAVDEDIVRNPDKAVQCPWFYSMSFAIADIYPVQM